MATFHDRRGAPRSILYIKIDSLKLLALTKKSGDLLLKDFVERNANLTGVFELLSVSKDQTGSAGHLKYQLIVYDIVDLDSIKQGLPLIWADCITSFTMISEHEMGATVFMNVGEQDDTLANASVVETSLLV